MARKLGEQLLSQGVLTSELLARALERQKATGQKIGECLVRLGLDETPVLRLLAQELQTRFVSTAKLAQTAVDSALLERVPVRLAEGFDFLPLRLDEAAGVLYCAMAEPQRQRAIEEIAKTVGVAKVLPFVAVRRSVRAAIRKHYYSDPHAFEHMGDDEVCPHCGAPSGPDDFQCARCELLLVRSPEDLPPRDNVSVVRALLSIPDRGGTRGVPERPEQDKTRVSSYTQAASGPPGIPVIIGGLDIAQKPLNPFEAYILSFVDGRTSLADMALITKLMEVELRAVFESLGERGVTKMTSVEPKRAAPARKKVELKDDLPATVPAPAAAPAPIVAQPQKKAPAAKPASAPAEKPADPTDDILQRIVRLERSGKINEAIELLESGISKLPKPAPLYNRLGLIILNQQRDYTRAAELFKKAAELDPDTSVYMMNHYSVLSLEAEATNPGKKVKRR
jgi:type IV pilus assembly protein PilB